MLAAIAYLQRSKLWLILKLELGHACGATSTTVVGAWSPNEPSDPKFSRTQRQKHWKKNHAWVQAAAMLPCDPQNTKALQENAEPKLRIHKVSWSVRVRDSTMNEWTVTVTTLVAIVGRFLPPILENICASQIGFYIWVCKKTEKHLWKLWKTSLKPSPLVGFSSNPNPYRYAPSIPHAACTKRFLRIWVQVRLATPVSKAGSLLKLNPYFVRVALVGKPG